MKAAVRGFPWHVHREAIAAALALEPFVDRAFDRGRIRTFEATVASRPIEIPKRIHFTDSWCETFGGALDSPFVACLASRSTNGYVRQQALRQIVRLNEQWSIPYVVLLIGDRVVEIGLEIRDSWTYLDRAVYAPFVVENRPLLRSLRERLAKDYEALYESEFPNRADFPGLRLLRQIDSWGTL